MWAVGDMCCHSLDDRCNSDVIKRFFDTLEPLTYEVSAAVATATDIVTSDYAKIISMLMSAIAKVDAVSPAVF